MALQRRGRGVGHTNIWAGFVDAMTGLLLVLMFVLTMFTIVQFVLRDEITGQASQLTEQETQLTQLTDQVASLASALGLERDRSSALTTNVGDLTTDLDEASGLARAQLLTIQGLTAERDAQAVALSDATTRITGFEAQVAGLLADRADAQTQIAGLQSEQTRLMDAQEALNLALASARTEISAGEEAARLSAARREAMETLVTSLQNDTAVGAETISDLEAARLVDAAAAEALRTRLADAGTELTAMTLALEDQRQAAEDTLTLLAAAEDAEAATNIKLATALLAQQAAEEGLARTEAEVDAMYTRLLASLTAQGTTSGELAAAQAALEAAETGAADLSTRLAAALAAQDLTEGNLADAQAALEAAVAQADLTQDEIEAKLAQAVLTQSALQAELAASGATAAEAQARLAAQLAAALETQTATQTALSNATQSQTDLEGRLAEALLAQQDLQTRLTDQTTTATESEADLRAQLSVALAAAASATVGADAQMTEAERQAALLAAANIALTEEQAISAGNLRQVALLNEQVAALRGQVGTLQTLLNVADDTDMQAQVQIEALGSQLNTALARVAAEERRALVLEQAERQRLEEVAARLTAEAQNLEQYRSEFFGRLREVLADQEGVRIEGDRFVFSSEVLFDAGRAELSDAGKAEIANVAAILRTISSDIPAGIDWVIRVDGHTDNVPLSGNGQFANNWQLSQARALSVVLYMIDNEGIPPNRLAANGFGEWQPLNTADTDQARAQNRRIELKLTER